MIDSARKMINSDEIITRKDVKDPTKSSRQIKVLVIENGRVSNFQVGEDANLKTVFQERKNYVMNQGLILNGRQLAEEQLDEPICILTTRNRIQLEVMGKLLGGCGNQKMSKEAKAEDNRVNREIEGKINKILDNAKIFKRREVLK
jgi:hypothetical protein